MGWGSWHHRWEGLAQGWGGLCHAWLLEDEGGLLDSVLSLPRMEALARRCPFLSRVSQSFLQKAGQSLLTYAQSCPVMMEGTAARALRTSAAQCQEAKETSPVGKESSVASQGKCRVPCG